MTNMESGGYFEEVTEIKEISQKFTENDNNKKTDNSNNKNNEINNENNVNIEENNEQKNSTQNSKDRIEKLLFSNQKDKENNPNNNSLNNYDNKAIDNNAYNNNKSLDKYTEVSKTGLKNLGDISYLNAVLQSLGQIKYFANYFLNKDIQSKIESNIKVNPLSFVTARLFLHLYPYPPKPEFEIYQPKSYFRVLKSLNCIYDNYQRKNPNELLVFILNTLHNELNLADKNSNEINNYQKDPQNEYRNFLFNDKSIISETLTFCQWNEISCTNCKSSLSKFRAFNTYDLDINNTFQNLEQKRSLNIYDCLNYQFNKTQALYCYSCGEITSKTIISKIINGPKVFIFLLERGDNFDKSNQNIAIPFTINEKIDLREYILEKESSYNYELTGIVSISPNNKKYISFCKSAIKDEWYSYDDKNVEYDSFNNNLKKNNDQMNYIPCILYYSKIEN